ncbi:MAG: FtsW/RodA/SpoVE family cell cycle protein [Pseudomonadota bacterium]
MNLVRTDTSILGRWWWTVDRWTLAALGCLIGLGAVLAMAATPAVATRIGLDPFHFVRRQFALLPPAIAILLATSVLSPKNVRRLALIAFLLAMTLLASTFVAGAEIKGARRWINLLGMSVQPSEFVKPSFAVLAAWLFTLQRRGEGFPGFAIAIGLYSVVVSALYLQPDIGMAIVVSAVWFGQFFLAGLRMYWALVLAGAGLAGLVASYFVFPHVASRINRFLDPSSGDSYQIDTALDAFRRGGLLGRGPGEGTVKSVLPDAHSDFVFAVAGEEFGLLVCLIVVGLFAFIVLRGFARALADSNLFVLLAVSGLLLQFGLQALINMGSSLHLIPTKGMTLPFISYGGSSLLALSLGMGMVLALTRTRFGAEDRP